jgi:hypothetical protein
VSIDVFDGGLHGAEAAKHHQANGVLRG